MLLLILLFLVCSEVSLSSLGPSDHPSNSSPDLSTRTTAGIFWSCLTTLIACTWTSIHPNIPARETSEWQLWWQRGKIFLIALVAPELIIHWALIQYRCSRQTVREFRKLFPDSCGNLTYTHGMFLVMGGFMLIGENGRVSVLQEPEIKILLHNRKIIFPAISKDEIMDRSKADVLAKALALVQTTWFIAQVISRAVQHLPSTQLEITTVAFAFLNVLIYMLWWNKPQNVRYPIMVPLLKSSPSPRTHLISASMNGVQGDNIAHLSDSSEDTGSSLVPSRLGATDSGTSAIPVHTIPTKKEKANPSNLEQGLEPSMVALDWPSSIVQKLLRSYTELCRIVSW